MNYDVAIGIFKLPYNFSKKDVFSRYRELVKLNHPDNNSKPDLSIRDISLAKEVLLDYLKNPLQHIVIKKEREFINISLKELVEIYRNKSSNGITLNKLIDGNSYINFDIDINNKEYKLASKFIRDDNYTLNLSIDSNLVSGDSLEVKIGSYIKNVKVASSNLRLSFNLEYNINIILNIFINKIGV